MLGTMVFSSAEHVVQCGSDLSGVISHMKCISVLLIVLFMSVSLLMPSSWAQSAYFMQQFQAGMEGYQRGQYAVAEKSFAAALQEAEKPGAPDAQTARRLNNWAEVYRAEAKYTAAEPLYKRALTITERALGPDSPEVARSLANLGELYRVQSRYAEADPFYKRAVAIDEKARPNHPDLATCLNDLALSYDKQGRTEEAEALYKRALAIYEKTSGPDSSDVSAGLNNLAALYEQQ